MERVHVFCTQEPAVPVAKAKAAAKKPKTFKNKEEVKSFVEKRKTIDH